LWRKSKIATGSCSERLCSKRIVEERNRDNGEHDLPEELSHKLSIFANYLKTKYIDSHWPENNFIKFTVWDGVDKDNQGWHTDMFEDYDVFFLYYYDDSE
jgi:hypothetical protein